MGSAPFFWVSRVRPSALAREWRKTIIAEGISSIGQSRFSSQSSGPLSPFYPLSHKNLYRPAAITARIFSLSTLFRSSFWILLRCFVFSGATTLSSLFFGSMHDVPFTRTTIIAFKRFSEAVGSLDKRWRWMCVWAEQLFAVLYCSNAHRTYYQQYSSAFFGLQ